MRIEVDDQYKAPIIAKLLHALPHYNITLHKTNSTFRPTDEVYLEVKLKSQFLRVPYSIKSHYFITEFRFIGLSSCGFVNSITVWFVIIFIDSLL